MPLKDKNQFAREPKQSRSKASLERLAQTATELLAKNGYKEFTLQEVSRQSNVSIGSIYNRFRGKEDLVRFIQDQELGKMDVESAVIINKLRRKKLPLRKLVPELIEVFAEHLKKHSSLLRAFMEIAVTDELVRSSGRKHFLQNMHDFEMLILERSDEIRSPNSERAVSACFMMIYASVSRYLGLGLIVPVEEGGWQDMLKDLSDISLYYLLGDPELLKG